MWSNQAPDFLVFPPGADSGARLTIDASGIRVFDAGNNVIWELTPQNVFAINQVQSFPDGGGHTSEISMAAGVITLAPLTSGGAHSNFLFGANNTGNLVVDSNALTNDTYQFGNGPLGGYYYEEVTINSQVLNSGGTFQLTGTTQTFFYCDYNIASGFAGGTWTCPETGPYDITFILGIGAWVAGSELRLLVEQNGTIVAIFDDTVPAVGGIGSGMVVFRKVWTKGDQAKFFCLQATGAAKGTATAGGSYITIKRDL